MVHAGSTVSDQRLIRHGGYRYRDQHGRLVRGLHGLHGTPWIYRDHLQLSITLVHPRSVHRIAHYPVHGIQHGGSMAPGLQIGLHTRLWYRVQYTDGRTISCTSDGWWVQGIRVVPDTTQVLDTSTYHIQGTDWHDGYRHRYHTDPVVPQWHRYLYCTYWLFILYVYIYHTEDHGYGWLKQTVP